MVFRYLGLMSPCDTRSSFTGALLPGPLGPAKSSSLDRSPRTAPEASVCYSRRGQTTGVRGPPAREGHAPAHSSLQRVPNRKRRAGEGQGHPRHPESKNKPRDATREGTSFLSAPIPSGSDLTSCHTSKAQAPCSGAATPPGFIYFVS